MRGPIRIHDTSSHAYPEILMFTSSPLLLAALTGLIPPPAGPATRAAIERIVGRYQHDIAERYGVPADLRFTDSSAVEISSGHDREGRLGITVHAGMLQALDSRTIVPVICHELGHILGSVPMRVTGHSAGYDDEDSVEGEADYFGGRCTSEEIGGKAASALISEVYEKLYEKRINPAEAESSRFENGNGIDWDYPAPECRVLSAIRGALGGKRPTCWYAPR
jgi:hypothetical protein